MESEELDKQGFVLDFKKLKETVLEPCHKLLDHGYAVSDKLFNETSGQFAAALAIVGEQMLETRREIHGTIEGTGRWLMRVPYPGIRPELTLGGAYDVDVCGMKIVVFPFPPTSERLAWWLYNVTNEIFEGSKVRCKFARVYETLHPVQSVAEFSA